METVVIVVPVYKSSLTATERASFLQLLTVLGGYPIKLLTHRTIDLSVYMELAGDKKIEPVFFSTRYFRGTGWYNKLLISRQFYQRFSHFSYLLIYQLDAWVFKDTLLEWCGRNFDYIGAPWYRGFTYAEAHSEFIGVGNGGLSLRKISTHLKALNRFSYARDPVVLMKKRIGQFGLTFRNLMHILAAFTFRNNTFYLFNDYDYNEDSFWGEVVAENFSWFKVPDELVASQFSMEINAPQLYERLGRQLPFGCHGWCKYHQDFWLKLIHVEEQ